MFNKINVNKFPKIYSVLFFVAIFAFGTYLFHKQITISEADITGHLNLLRLVVENNFKFPELGFEYSILFLSKLFNLSFEVSATLILSLVFCLLAFCISFILKKFLVVSSFERFFYTILLLVPSAIYVPLFSHYIYLGPGSPNVWHNPTLFMVKPLAFLITYFSVLAFEKNDIKKIILSSLLLVISMFFKPSFAFVFLPSLSVFILVYFRDKLLSYWYGLIIFLPSFLFGLWQAIILLKYGYPGGRTTGVIFDFLGVLHLYSPNVFISTILGIAFPISLLILQPSSLKNKYLLFSWLMLFFGYLQMIFLAEKGAHFGDGNFFWGYLIAMQLVFLFSFIELYKLQSLFEKSESMSFYRSTVFYKIAFLDIVFSLHLISGIIFLYRILLYNNYF